MSTGLRRGNVEDEEAGGILGAEVGGAACKAGGAFLGA